MIEYSLDTNACITLINGSSPRLRARFAGAIEAGAVVCVSTVVQHELWYGVAKSARRDVNAQRVSTFLSGLIDVLPFDDADARAAGTVRALLERAGTPIGAYDTMIAGQALRRGFTVVTTDVTDFGRVDDLMWEDWAR